MSNNKDFKVKNGIQPTVYHEGLGTVVSGSEGYYLAGASYDSVSFSVAGQDIAPFDLAFNTDGTKMYMLGNTDDTLYQYSLSTAFDLSTASYDSVSFSVTGQDSNANAIVFNNDGTKMYMVGIVTDSIYQYSLSTAFDLSTASYDSVSFSVASQDTNPHDIAFNNNGTKMYMLGNTYDDVFQYSLSTAFDLSTASYDSVSLDASSLDSAVQAIVFNNDGTKMYLSGGATGSIYQYSLSTAFDLSTAFYDSVSFSVTGQEAIPRGVVFNSDGNKMYIIGNVSDSVHQYSTALTTNALDLSTGSVFEVTPTSDIQVILSNPADSGTVSGATLLLTGEAVDTAGVGDVFSTSLYEGNGSTQTITNGIDLDGEGGLVWLKKRSGIDNSAIYDTERGATKYLTSVTAGAELTIAQGVQSFNSDGFSIGSQGGHNDNGATFASWTFRKAPNFFDIQTFSTTYNIVPSTLTHTLDAPLGMAIFKRLDGVGNWVVWHKDLGTRKYLRLNDTSSQISDPTYAPTYDEASKTFSFYYPMSNTDDRLIVGNAETSNWVGYFFASDTAADSRIKCGSYVGGGSTDVEINLGWQPQWLLIRRSDAAEDWFLVDSERGFGIDGVDTAKLKANSSEAETTSTSLVATTPTGFKTTDDNAGFNSAGGTYIYMAIRGTYTPTITYDPTLEWPGGTAPTAPDIGETDVVTFNTRDGGSTYQGVLAIDGAK